MRIGIFGIALAMIGSGPAFAGSAVYNRPGAEQVKAAIQVCQPKITEAQNALVSLRLTTNDPKAKHVENELGQARAAMETGHADECLAHAANAQRLVR